MQKNSDTGILEGLPDDVWDGIMQDTEPERFRFNEDAKTLDELLPDDVAVSLMGLEDECSASGIKTRCGTWRAGGSLCRRLMHRSGLMKSRPRPSGKNRKPRSRRNGKRIGIIQYA